MKIVNPSFGRLVDTGEKVTARPIDWASDAIVLLNNSKPNATELLEGIRQKLKGVRSIDNIEHLGKNSASQPAPVELIDKVSQKYKAALLALAD